MLGAVESGLVANLLACLGFRIKLGRSACRSLFSQGLLDEFTCCYALAARKALCFDLAVAFGVDGDFNLLVQAAPPT